MSLALRQLSTADAGFEADLQRLLHWSAETDAAIEGRVAQIIADVRERGDAALLELTARFDGLQAASMAALEIGPDELRAALPPFFSISKAHNSNEDILTKSPDTLIDLIRPIFLISGANSLFNKKFIEE